MLDCVAEHGCRLEILHNGKWGTIEGPQVFTSTLIESVNLHSGAPIISPCYPSCPSLGVLEIHLGRGLACDLRQYLTRLRDNAYAREGQCCSRRRLQAVRATRAPR